MKLTALSLLFVIFASHISLAQVAVAPAPSVVPSVVAPVAAVASVGVLALIKAHWGEICFALSWLIEGIFYFSPSLKANGLLEQFELWIKGQSTPPVL